MLVSTALPYSAGSLFPFQRLHEAPRAPEILANGKSASVRSVLSDLDTGSVVRSEQGTGGVYFLANSGKTGKVVFKPLDEESFSTGGQGFLKEFAAYILDNGIAGVPETTISTISLGTEERLGSVQAYVEGVDAEDYGPGVFSLEDVHRIGILDIRLLNCDRHSANYVIDSVTGRLTPIDHGSSFPSAFEEGALERVSFEWLMYPQSKQPFSEELLEVIRSINVVEDVRKLDQVGLAPGELLSTWMSTTLLKMGARHGRTLYEIGSWVQREGDRSKPSHLERLFQESLLQSEEQGGETFFSCFAALAEELVLRVQ